jgi:hypothetical protein
MPDIDDVKYEDDIDTYDQYIGSHTRVSIGDEIRYEIRYGKVVLRQLNVGHKNM